MDGMGIDVIDALMASLNTPTDDFPTDKAALDVLRSCIDDCQLTARELQAMKMRLGLDGQAAASREEICAALDMQMERLLQIERKLLRHSPLNPYRRENRTLLP